jgi:hypothetical protein
VNKYPGKISSKEISKKECKRRKRPHTPDAGGEETEEEKALTTHSGVAETGINLGVQGIK